MQEGADVINLGQGNPDQPTPPHIVKAMQEAVAKPENHQYSSFRGTAKLKKLQLLFMKENMASRLTQRQRLPSYLEGKRD